MCDLIVIHSKPRIIDPQKLRAFKDKPLESAVLSLLFVGLLVIVVGSLRTARSIDWIASLSAVVLIFVVPIALARVNAKITIDHSAIVYRDAFRISHHCIADEVRQVVRVRLNILGRGNAFTKLLLLNAADQAMVAIYEAWWREDDILRLQSALNVAISDYGSAISARDANSRFPGSAGFGSRHFFISMMALLCAILGLILLISTLVN